MNNIHNTTFSMIVACHDSNGVPTTFTHKHSCLTGDYHETQHSNLAKAAAAEYGHKQPFICYPPSRHEAIAESVKSAGASIPLNLKDMQDSDHNVTGRIFLDEQGISIAVDGYSDYHSADSEGAILTLENNSGKPCLYIYSDINEDTHTNVFDFDYARNECRDNE